MTGKINIGLKQAQRLAQLSPKQRLAFLAEGLPLIRDSALSFWSAACALNNNPREREVLEGFAEEEAAKGLILMDIVRCPSALLPERMQPMHTRQLQEYVDSSRKTHDLEGYVGEYIIPNWEEYRRESQLYVDIAAFEDGKPVWSAPIAHQDFLFGEYVPAAIQVIDALHHLGLTTESGLKATGEVWGQITFRDVQGFQEVKGLVRQLIERAVEEKLPLETAENKHVQTLYCSWQIPMYLLDLRKIAVPLKELRERQDAMLWAEAGY